MSSVSEYKLKIQSLNLDGLELNLTSLSDGKAALKQCRDHQRELRQIKKSIGLDVKTIRAEYWDKIANAGSVMGGAFSLIWQKRLRRQCSC